MDSFEWNKVFASLLIGALLVMVISTLTSAFLGGGSHDSHGVSLAYSIDVPEAATVEAVVEEGPSLAALIAAADMSKGEREFSKCRACHTIEKGGANKLGPNLYGVMGRTVAAADGFAYSSALTGYGGEWTWERMDAWLRSPKTTVPGNAMSFNGISKDPNRANLLAYLNATSDAPITAPEIETEPALADDASE